MKGRRLESEYFERVIGVMEYNSNVLFSANFNINTNIIGFMTSAFYKRLTEEQKLELMLRYLEIVRTKRQTIFVTVSSKEIKPSREIFLQDFPEEFDTEFYEKYRLLFE